MPYYGPHNRAAAYATQQRGRRAVGTHRAPRRGVANIGCMVLLVIVALVAAVPAGYHIFA